VNEMDERSITRHRNAIRAGLLAIGVPFVIVGGWALMAPHGWYETFPGGGRHWVSALGPYDEHLVRDFGSTYLALGLLLAASAMLLDRLLVQAALAASLVFQVPHFVFHLANKEQLSSGDYVANNVLLGAALVLSVVLLAAVSRPRPAAAPKPIPTEGGLRYGTR
jgi:hypothetical protein